MYDGVFIYDSPFMPMFMLLSLHTLTTQIREFYYTKQYW